jgi:hypothetical protein
MLKVAWDASKPTFPWNANCAGIFLLAINKVVELKRPYFEFELDLSNSTVYDPYYKKEKHKQMPFHK